jgi:hypothetical protein
MHPTLFLPIIAPLTARKKLKMAGNASRHGLSGMASKSADELLQLIFLYRKSASAEKTTSAEHQGRCE